MEVKKKKKKKKYPNHGHDKQRQRLNESELEALRGGERSEKWGSLTDWFKQDWGTMGMGAVPYLLRLLVKVEELEML